MINTGIETSTSNRLPTQKVRLLGPALATAITFPVLMAVASTFLLWTVHAWDVPVWAVLLGIILLATAGLYSTWRLMLAWAKRNFQFSLRGMLITMGIIALALGIVGRPLRQRIRLSQALLNVAENGGSPESWTGRKKNWLEARLGYDPFDEIKSIKVRTYLAIPSLLQHADAFTELEQLSFHRGITDASVKYAAEFNKLPKLSYGSFYNTQLTDKGMQQLKKWTRVRQLFFNGGVFTDKGLKHLKNLSELESLTLIGDEYKTKMPITDQGLVHIGKMSNLKNLTLIGIPITDVGLANLQNLTDLERLCLRRTNITESGFLALCKTLPNCWSISEFAHFPIAAQIRQITVWRDYPEKQQLLTISDPAQIIAILECLERFVSQNKGWWTDECFGDTQDSISLEIDGPDRLLCRPSFGDDFFQTGWGLYCPLSSADASELRKILGVDTGE